MFSYGMAMPRRICTGVIVLSFCLSLGAYSPPQLASSPPFGRGPFVQNASTNRIQIIWRTALFGSTFVEYGLTPALGLSVTNDTMVTNHIAALTNLTPDTTYYYRAGTEDAGGRAVSSVESFRTLKVQGPVSFVVFGDSGGATPAASNIAAVAHTLRPDLVVHLGDATADGFTEMRMDRDFFNMYQPQLRSTPYYLCVGNHDIETAYGVWGDTLATNFQNTYYLPTNSMDGTECYYSFDHGDAHLVCLFNPWFTTYVFTNGSPQYRWLTNDLAASRKPWKLVFLHAPIAHSGYHANADRNANAVWDQHEMMSLLLPVAEQHGVQMVFGSHDHNFERFAPTNGLHHCVSGGGGRRLYQMYNRHAASAQFWQVYHCLRVGVTNDTLTIEAYDQNGLLFEAMTVQKALPPLRLYQASWHTPAIEAGPADDGDGNINGQTFDFAGPPLYPRAGRFSNLGRVYVNNDETNVYVGFQQVMLYSSHNVFLFIDSPHLSGVSSMEGVGNGSLDAAGQGADGLDCLENLSFANFSPAIGCILGDEYADGQFRSFARSNLALNIGQGVYRLEASLGDVPGVRLQQYNRSPQTGPISPTNGVTLEQNADFMELVIPLAELGGLQPGEVLKLGAVVGGDGFDSGEQTRQLDTSVLGYSLSGSGLSPVVLEGLSVQLASGPGAIVLRVSITPTGPGQFMLAWNSVAGRSYLVEHAGRLPEFTPLDDPRLPVIATHSMTTLSVTRPANEAGFFRVRQLP